MGSTSYNSKSKLGGYRAKSGSSAGSDKEMNGKLRRAKIRRPGKMNEYGLKRIPDYTELAYKEAVSKLRYFLSGNYAPSARSYGSPSIKNLDESDGDLDKKYSSSYNTLTEYKPRPRLTAKYTTLYADSLTKPPPVHFNRAPSVNTTTNPVAADVTGGTNPDVINFIQKQEEYIEQLERESQYCRDELNNLLGKVKEVISENEHLHEAQKNKLISRMFHSYNAGSESDELDDVGDSTGLDSDNKTTPSKGRKTTKSRSSRLEGPNIVFESRISELEAQLSQAKIDLKKVQDENNENKRKLASGLVDSTCLDGFKRQIDNLQRDKNTLESQISKLKFNLEQKDDGYKKGSDAIEQQLREERNNLEAEVRRLKDDLTKERSKVRELAGEGARRVIQERSAAEQRYNAHFDELQHDLAAQYDNVSKLQLDLERQRREENDLKRELSMKNSAIEELKMELKNKLASLQADLAQAHAEKASLEEELASARLAIERHQRQSKHETNRLNSEIQSLRQRLDRADADLVHSRRENLRLSEQIATLEKELNMKDLSPLSPEKKNKKEKELSTMFESMENKHAKTVAELESMIKSQNSLMEKLTGECRLLTDKLDDASRKHKAEKIQLLCRNTELMRKLRNLWCSHKKYCTTTITPYRSYTPLSGYPNSRSSYDLDRTYYTSTPYTYRNRFRRNDDYNKYSSFKDDIGDLTRNLSDLSLDKIGDSDDDPLKCARVCFRQELATLQRQVEQLGRSLLPAHPTPSAYQAPSTHTTSANSNSIYSPTNPRPEYTGANPARFSRVGDQPISNVRPDRVNSDDGEASVVRNEDITKASSNNQDYDVNPPKLPNNNILEDTQQSQRNSNAFIEKTDNEIADEVKYDEKYDTEKADLPENRQEYETKNYDADNYENYDQNYEQPGTEETEYPNQEHNQNYAQPDYAGEQYENYEQYPQYSDPNTNTEYEGQYDNYAADVNYQNEQNYEGRQYETNNQEFNIQDEQMQQNNESSDSQINNLPKETLSSENQS